VNGVRSMVSRIAGGRLAAASRCPVVTLAISDVVGGPVETIGSGPTLPPVSNPAAALRTLRDRRIAAADSVMRYLRDLANDASAREPPGSGAGSPPTRSPSSFHMIASIDDAISAAETSLRSTGYRVIVVDRAVQGEARVIGERVVEMALRARSADQRATALLWGGETTVTVTGGGTGGRNQELALSAAFTLDNHDGITIASLATDGSDGPTAAAGAIVNRGTILRALRLGLDPAAALRDNDSHALLDAVGDLVRTGPTGTNVNDLIMALID
jgi:glycerate 2-kinase